MFCAKNRRCESSRVTSPILTTLSFDKNDGMVALKALRFAAEITGLAHNRGFTSFIG